MSNEYTLEQYINYLLDVLEVQPGPLPGRANGYWDDVFRIASEQRSYHYLASWVLTHWSDALPAEMKHQIGIDIAWNRTRNIKLTQEIVELAKMFNDAEIPVIFLKGSAGVVRGLYQLECRYISDIDVMVKEEDIEKVKRLFDLQGYTVAQAYIGNHTHHLPPYHRSDLIAWVEIHKKPYIHYFDNNNIMNNIWSSCDMIRFHDVLISIPSITDHVWILLRTDFIEKVYFPRVNDGIEVSNIIRAGYKIDFAILSQRSEHERIPNIIPYFFYIMKRFTGLSSSIQNDNVYNVYLEKWINNGISFQQKQPNAILYRRLRLYYASIKCFSANGMRNKLQLLFLLLMNEPPKRLIKLFLYPEAGIMITLKSIKRFFSR